MTTGPLAGVTGVILAGGQSSRMGSNKALLPYQGGRFIEAIHRQLRAQFAEVILVTNNPEQYPFLPCRKVPDLYPGMGALAGIHAGLSHSMTERIFVVACDMPYLNSRLIRHIACRPAERAVVVPCSDRGTEPLHARYDRSCLAAVERCLREGKKRIISFYPEVSVEYVGADEVAVFDPDFATFSNINTPQEYYRLRDGEHREPPTPAPCRKPQAKSRAAAG